jgi:hypothetical protein
VTLGVRIASTRPRRRSGRQPEHRARLARPSIERTRTDRPPPRAGGRGVGRIGLSSSSFVRDAADGEAVFCGANESGEIAALRSSKGAPRPQGNLSSVWTKRLSLAVRSLVLRHPKHFQGSYDYGPALCKVCCCPDSPLLWIRWHAEWPPQLPGSGSKRCWYEAYLVSFGARQRLAAWTAHRAAVESPELIAAIRRKLERDEAFPNVSSPISGLKRSTWAKCLA